MNANRKAETSFDIVVMMGRPPETIQRKLLQWLDPKPRQARLGSRACGALWTGLTGKSCCVEESLRDRPE